MKAILIILSFIVVFSVNSETLENRLKNHASPYLAMHGSDPVAWQEWNKETVARAVKEGKVLYVSSGYFSCHWCHVMQRESYKNAHVAKLLNTYFIPVKVDREINSALDSRLIDFVERTQGRAGWPLNVFITPDGYPLVGMTYVPAANFIEILKKVKTRWKKEKSVLEDMARNVTNELSSVAIKSSDKIDKKLSQKYIKRFLISVNTMTDTMAGGFGQQNKFPLFPQLKALLTLYENNHDEDIKQFLLLTLESMSSQGLNDHLSGGFFRYTIDPGWHTPHFEKMLYDNALLASLYLDAARIFKNKKFAEVAKHTLNYMLDTLLSKKGALIASLSAVDDKGIEGGYYLWQRDEIEKVLSKDEFSVVELIWRLKGPTELDAGHHLVEAMNINEVSKKLKISSANVKKYFNSAKKKMLKTRTKRKIPRDDKLLASWNALALSAYSKAAKQFNNVRYARAAKDIKNYIKKSLWINNELVRAVKNNKVLGDAGLEDYAYVAQGLYDWIEFSNDEQDKRWLDEIVSQAWEKFYTNKGWLLEENSLLKYVQSEAILFDGVLPSASATLINVSLRVAKKNNNLALMKKVLRALNVGHAEIMSQPFMYASHIMSIFELQKPTNIVLNRLR